MAQDVSITDKVTTSFRQLEAAATRLNTVSDELGEPITAIEGVLKRLNLGVPAWVKFAGDFDGNTGAFWRRELGYAKIGSKWGIALRTVEGDAGDPGSESVESWLFSDAPRSLRLEAVAKLPELLEALIKEAESISEKINNKIGEAKDVAVALTKAAAASQQQQRRK